MLNALRLFLILTLALTGQTLASARGQAQAVGEIVICAGTAVTTITVDRNGQPVETTHICPDMALSLLAFVPAPEAEPARDAAERHLQFALVQQDAVSLTVPQAVARGPPLLSQDFI